MPFLLIFIFTLISYQAQAAIEKVKNESELTFIQTGGNSNVESYNLKTATSILTQDYTFSLSGHYFLSTYEKEDENGSLQDIESARNWDIALKGERNLSKRFNAFSQVQFEGDKFSGYTQRDNYDIGGKYKIITTDKENLFVELGYRYTVERKAEPAEDEDSIKYDNKGRLYAEYDKKISEALSSKFWIEYLPNFTEEEDYIISFEPSLSVLLNNIFSLKMAYKGIYDNQPNIEGNKYLDFNYTTSLIARY